MYNNNVCYLTCLLLSPKSLKNLRNIMDRNVAFNTLLAVAMPNERALYALPISDRGIPVWQTSALKNHEEHLQIVWVAKEGNPDNVLDDERRPVIEAHYAGSKHKCLHFVQTHPLVPQGAVCIKRDLSGVDVKDNGNNVGHSQNIELSWTLTGDIGDAVLDGSISELPEVCTA